MHIYWIHNHQISIVSLLLNLNRALIYYRRTEFPESLVRTVRPASPCQGEVFQNSKKFRKFSWASPKANACIIRPIKDMHFNIETKICWTWAPSSVSTNLENTKKIFAMAPKFDWLYRMRKNAKTKQQLQPQKRPRKVKWGESKAKSIELLMNHETLIVFAKIVDFN